MDNFNPGVTAEDLAAATTKRTFTAVEKGEYSMVIEGATLGISKKTSQPYLVLKLGHVGELSTTAKKADALFAMDEKRIGARQFAQMLLAIGNNAEQVAGSTWVRSPDASVDESGRSDGAAQLGNGEIINLVGRELRAYLSKKDETYTDKNTGEVKTVTKNRAESFLIG